MMNSFHEASSLQAFYSNIGSTVWRNELTRQNKSNYKDVVEADQIACVMSKITVYR